MAIIYSALQFMIHSIEINGILIISAVIIDLIIRMIPTKRPSSLFHWAGHAIMRAGYHMDKVFPQKLK